MSRTRINVAVAALLWLAHLGVIALFGTNASGPFLSDSIQFSLGMVMIFSAVQASRRSEGLACSFWRLVAVAYSLLGTAQCLSVYNDLAASSPVSWINNLLFYIGFIWILVDKRRRGWHDLIAGTCVIEA